MGSAVATAQVPSTSAQEFEVASVKALEPGSTGYAIGPPVNGTIRYRGAQLRRLVSYAFGLDPNGGSDYPLPEGGPDWIDRDLFEVQARGPADMSVADARLMLRALLEERFKLRVHIVKREGPVYALVLAREDRRLGEGLRVSKSDCTKYSETLLRTGRGVLAQPEGRDCMVGGGGGLGGGRLQIRGTGTMREILRQIQAAPDVDRPVFDRTGLTGTFDFNLIWAPARTGPAAARPEDVVAITTALQEQFGLRLESRREMLEVLVIDSVERPTPN
jgi:uncharacterized protein (TIGR03435 family)